MIKLKDILNETTKEELEELALKVDRHHNDIKRALETLTMIGRGDDRHDIKKMQSDLVDFLNDKLYKKYGKDVEIK